MAACFACGKDLGRDIELDLVKTAVERIAASPDREIELVTRDLREIKGKVSAVGATAFKLEPIRSKSALITLSTKRRKNQVPPPPLIYFKDVLQLEGDGLTISFVPDPNKVPHGSWAELREIAVGEFLQIHLKDGTKRHGVFRNTDDTSVTVVRGNNTVRLERQDVARLYRVGGDTRGLAAKLAKGGQAGAKVTDAILPINDPRAIANPAALGLGAGIGALLYLLPKRSVKRVLVHSQ